MKKMLSKLLIVISGFFMIVVFASCLGGGDAVNMETEWRIIQYPTCEQNGIEERINAEGNPEQREIPKLEHQTEIIYGYDSSCNQTGMTDGERCIQCGKWINEQKEIPLKEHSFTVESSNNPTCTQNGFIDSRCNICGEYRHEEIPSTGEHIYSQWVVFNEPQMEVDGELRRACLNCFVEESRVLPMFSSGQYEENVIMNSTCYYQGEAEYRITVDGQEYCFNTSLPMLEHDIFYEEMAPTCLDSGFTVERCKNCEHWATIEEISPLDHEFGDWIMTIAPTMNSSGELIRECSRDSEHKDYYILPDLQSGMYEIISVQEPTCLEKGIARYLFSNYLINIEVVVETPKLEHILERVEYKEPTCLEDGHTSYYYCYNCDYSTYEKLEATGHLWSEWNTVISPTCVNEGRNEKVCQYCFETEFEVLSAKGHNLSQYEKLEPTCINKGYEAYEKCSDCNYTTYKEIASLGHISETHTCAQYQNCSRCGIEYTLPHKYNTLQHDYLAHWYSCDECGFGTYCYTYHEYDDWAYNVLPTCNTEGTYIRTCIGCDYYEEKVARYTHNYVDDNCDICGIPKPTEGLIFELNNDYTYTVVGIESQSTRIVIPQVYDNAYVTAIADKAFFNKEFIEEVFIPNTVKNIGEQAFAYCDNLNKISFSESVDIIENEAFFSTNISEVYYDGNISSWMKYTFENKYTSPMYRGASIYTPNSSGEFEKVSSITLHSNVRYLGDYIFCGFKDLCSLTLGEFLDGFGKGVFDGCTSLQGNIYENCQYIGNEDNPYLLLYKAVNTEIESCVTNSNTKMIYHKAFENCSKLTEVEMNKEIEYIGESILFGASSLVSITVPFTGSDKDSTKLFGYLFGTQEYFNSYLAERPNDTFLGEEYYVPYHLSNVTVLGGEIKANEFASYLLKEVILEEGITSIGSRAFYNCTALRKLSIPNSIESIGASIIEDTSSTAYTYLLVGKMDNYGYYLGNEENPYLILYEATLPSNYIRSEFVVNENTKIISNDVIKGSISIFHFGTSVKYIASNAFVDGTDLSYESDTFTSQVKYEGTLKDWMNINFGNIYANPMSQAHIFSLEKNDDFEQIGNIEVPSDVYTIKPYTFAGFDTISELIIPENVLEIGTGALWGMEGLTKLTVPFVGYDSANVEKYGLGVLFIDRIYLSTAYPNSIAITQKYYKDGELTNISCHVPSGLKEVTIINDEIINEYALYNMSMIDTLRISSITTKVEKNAFENCTLKEVYLHSNLKVLEENAFNNNGLDNLYYDGTIEDWTEITFETMGSTPMYYGVEFNIMENGEYALLEDIEIPRTVTTLNNYQFAGFKFIKSYKIHEELTNYCGQFIFYNNMGLEDIYYTGDIYDWCQNTYSGYQENPMWYAENFKQFDQLDVAYNVTSIVIPNNIDALNAYAFSGFDNVVEYYIYPTVKKMGDNAFILAESPESFTQSKLENIYYYGTIANWLDIDFDNGITSTPMYHGVKFNIQEVDEEWVEVTEIIIPDGNEVIKLHTIQGFDNVVSLTIPESIKVSNNYFYQMEALETVYYKGSEEEWCNILFFSTYSTPMYYAESFKRIIDNQWSEVVTFTIPEDITKINYYQFYGFDNLENLYVSCNTKSFETQCFDETVLSNVYYSGTIENWLENTFASINSNPLHGGTNLILINGEEEISPTKIVINNEIINKHQFVGMKNLEEVVLEANVSNVRDYAFASCQNLVEMKFDNEINITCFEKNAISNSNKLKFNTYENGNYLGTDNNAYYLFIGMITDAEELVIHRDTKSFVYNLSVSSSILKKLSAPNFGLVNLTFSYTTVEQLESLTLYDQYELETLQFMRNLKELKINNAVFIGSNCLKDEYKNVYNNGYYIGSEDNPYYIFTGIVDKNAISVVIHEDTEVISNSALYNNSVVQTVSLPENLKSIGVRAFSKCMALKSISIPDSVENIGDFAFQGSSYLANISMPAIENFGIEAIDSNRMYECITVTSGKINDSLFAFSSVKNIIISDEVKEIEEYAFKSCSRLETVTLPSWMSEIPVGLFEGCLRLKMINTEGKITKINDFAFFNTAWFDSEVLSELTHIGNRAFAGVNVSEVIIPGKVEHIGEYAFVSCYASKIFISKSVKYIGEGAFQNCGEEIVFEDGIEEIEMGLAVFKGNVLKKIVFSNTMKSISTCYFASYYTIDVYIPKTVTQISELAFSEHAYLNFYYEGSLEEWMSIDNKQIATNVKLFLKNADGEWYDATNEITK